jgi:hypothetical protein
MIVKTIDDFIVELQSISEKKRNLPLVIECPNGMLVDPQIKMIFKEGTMFTKNAAVEKMAIAWR